MTMPVIGKLSLRELLGDEEKLIADYEAKKEARRQRRLAQAAATQEANQQALLLEKSISEKVESGSEEYVSD